MSQNDLGQDVSRDEVDSQSLPLENEEILSKPPVQPESRLQRFLRLSIRWVVGLLIVFLLGVLGTVLVLYLPATGRISDTQSELKQAEQRIAELESEVDQLENEIASLQGLEAVNKKLQEELDNANLHIIILSALSDVNAARVALVSDDMASARVHLTNTMDTLKELEKLVGSNQKEMVNSMQNRLSLVVDEMGDDLFAAQSDLAVLASNLVQLENTFFASH